MSRVAAPDEIDAQLAELERQRGEGAISDLAFTVQRNLLITRSQQAARRRDTARRLPPPPPPPPPPLPAHGGGQWQRVLSSRAAAWVLGAAFAAGVTLLAYHPGGSSAPSGSAPAASPIPASASSPPPTVAATPSASVTRVNQTQSTPGGGAVTLVGYQSHFSPTSVINNPLPSGAYYLAVELKVCASSQAPVTVSPFDYVLVEPDHTQVDVSSGPAIGIEPALQLTQLSSGHCVTGWLSYGVAAAPTTFSDTADNLSWPMS